MANVFDVFGRLLLDDTGFQADAKKAGEQAGDTVGSTMSKRVGTALKVGLTGVGAAGGLLFGIAAKGGAEATAAMAAFRAETGATEEEAAAANETLNKLWGSNLNGFDELGQVLASVHNDLGLSGDAAEVAAQQVLDYAKVTGQDAVAAVGTLDDLTDGYNLTAEQQADVLDKLVASHQKYGGSVQANQDALASLAPALNAANLSYDDGIGLLNLFAASGVDAAAAPAALTKALGKVKSPAELQKLIDDIRATEDPFARAQKASELFGAKAGPKLAQALSKGDLSDFTVKTEDAAGALEHASDVIDNQPFNQLQLQLRKLSGPLVEAGQQFGPLILGISQLGGGKLLASATSAIGGLGGALVSNLGGIGAKLLPALTSSLIGLVPAVTGAGTAIGSALAAAIPIGMAALPVLLVGAIVAAIIFLANNPEVVDSIVKFAEGAVQFIVDGFGKLVDALPGIITAAFDAIAAILPQLLGALVDIVLRLPGMLAELVPKLVGLWATAWRLILELALNAVIKIAGFLLELPGRISGLAAQLAAQVGQWVASMLPKVGELVGQVVAAILSIPGKVAGWVGGLIGQAAELAEGIRQRILNMATQVAVAVLSIPGRVVAWVGQMIGQAQQAAGAIGQRIIALAGQVVQLILSIPGRVASWVGSIVGQAATLVASVIDNARRGAQVVVGLILSIPGRIASWVSTIAGQATQLAGQLISTVTRLVGNIVQFFLSIPGRIASLGGRIVSSIINGMASLPGRIADVIRNAFANLRIDIGPFHISASGVRIDLPDLKLPGFAVGGPISAGTFSIVGERGPELFVPTVDGTVVPNSALSRSVVQPAAAQEVVHQHFNIPLPGVLEARTAEDIVRPLRQLAAVGTWPIDRRLVTARRRPAGA